MKEFKNKYLIVVIALIAIFIISIGLFLWNKQKNKGEDVSAGSSSSSVSTKAAWDAGTLNNIDSISAEGSIKIDNKIEAQIDTTGMTVTSGEPIDGDVGTYYGAAFGDPLSWQIDFGSNYSITTIISRKSGAYPGVIGLETSPNGTDWTTQTLNVIDGTESDATINSTIRYVRSVNIPPTPPGGWRIYELEFYGNASATHTTGATQIDGGANFWSWDGFTPSDTTPANTSVTYRYRTSTDGATWTGWVGAIGSVTSRTGDDSNNPTLYRYLQVEATLSNTDGASTPTIDSYDIDYHTEVKPTKPTAQTAVTE